MQKAKDSNGDILTQGLIGLKDTYTNKVYLFLGAHLQRTSKLNMISNEKFEDE
jgi:hypothetical protein